MEQFQIQLKRLGKKKVKTIDFELQSHPETVRDLITACVCSEVKRYNEKRTDPKLLGFLSPKQIQEQGEKGKIAFGDINNKTLADQDQALEVAFLAHKDGLFLVFVNDDEVTDLDQKIDWDPAPVFAFMRLTFLAGAQW